MFRSTKQICRFSSATKAAAVCDRSVGNLRCLTSQVAAATSHRGSSRQQNGGERRWGRYVTAGGVLAAVSAWQVYNNGVVHMEGSAQAEGSEEPTPTESGSPSVELPDIPEYVPYLIIGGGTAAYSAFKGIRVKQPDAKILIVGEEPHLPYMRPPLSKHMWAQTDVKKAREDLIFPTYSGSEGRLTYKVAYVSPKDLPTKDNGAVAVLTGRKVVKLDIQGKKAILDNGSEIKYDKCLLATGGTPANLPVFEKADSRCQKKITLYRNVEDFKKLHAEMSNVETVAVVGGGFLGTELASHLMQHGRTMNRNLKVIQTFPEAGNMGQVLPTYLCKWTTDRIRKLGVDIKPGRTVTACDFKPDTNQLELTLGEEKISGFSQRNKLVVDHVIVAVGLDPNTDLAESAGLEIDPIHRGYLANAELEARKDVWVAGDVCSFYDINLGRRRVEHQNHAVVSGRLAGENMTGAGKPYWHQSYFWSDICRDTGYEAIGLVDSKLPTMAFFAKEKMAEDGLKLVKADKDGKDSSEGSGGEEFNRGVVFYLRDKKIVGVVCWNVFGHIPIARQLIREAKEFEEIELEEVSKLFWIHKDMQNEPTGTDDLEETPSELPQTDEPKPEPAPEPKVEPKPEKAPEPKSAPKPTVVSKPETMPEPKKAPEPEKASAKAEPVKFKFKYSITDEEPEAAPEEEEVEEVVVEPEVKVSAPQKPAPKAEPTLAQPQKVGEKPKFKYAISMEEVEVNKGEDSEQEVTSQEKGSKQVAETEEAGEFQTKNTPYGTFRYASN